MNPVIETIERSYQKKEEEIPSFIAGDTVRLEIKVREGDKERLQAFEGIVIARKNTGLRENFTVRKISYGVGVERTFMLHSPNIASISVLRRGNVARAKLYYLRDRVGKKTRVKDKIFAKDKD
ncbi:MAG: 50S ribosomal protein L19 [Candidatus Riflebacteria bacterium]|jgi:large subunit ribosomal protein L19|nr:50S ribosomal protein L19 [Candidatus Riflebacteria bacterium]